MELCGIDINCTHIDNIFSNTSSGKILVTVNAEAIVRAQTDKKLAHIIADNLTSIDGQIPLWLYRLRHPFNKINKISGSDLIYDVAKWAARNNKRIFLLGGKSDSNQVSCIRLPNLFPGLIIQGFSPEYSPYPFPSEKNDEIIDKISCFNPDILFVGFGMGKQEFWAADNLEYLKSLGIGLIIGCGGTFEFVSGAIKRAPKIIQSIGFESIWRLMKEFRWFRIKRLLLSFGIFYYYFFPKIGKKNSI